MLTVKAVIASVALAFTSLMPGSTTPAGNPYVFTMPDNGQAGVVIQDSLGPRLDNPFVIEDTEIINGRKMHAPMFWVNVGGAYSGATRICVTALDIFTNEVCLNANGSVMLSSNGNRPVTLWAHDVRWLHRLEVKMRG